jgi:hypothetical protein
MGSNSNFSSINGGSGNTGMSGGNGSPILGRDKEREKLIKRNSGSVRPKSSGTRTSLSGVMEGFGGNFEGEKK